MASTEQSVQTFGKKKTATAVAFCKAGSGLIRVNGAPLKLFGSPILQPKLFEPLLVLTTGRTQTNPFTQVDIRVRVTGGGHTSQIYAVRQALSKAVVAFTAKYVDASSALEVKKTLIAYDRTLLVADPRRMEPKRFGGKGARARYQMSLRFFGRGVKSESHCTSPTASRTPWLSRWQDVWRTAPGFGPDRTQREVLVYWAFA